MTKKPILLDIPDRFETERLIIRIPNAGDSKQLIQAIKESHERLIPWFPWAKEIPTEEESEARLRASYAKYLLREDFLLHLYLKDSGTLIGSSGLHVRDWNVPKFEIGYWVRTGYEGKGLITEAVTSITKFGFDIVGAKKILIRMNSKNLLSEAVAIRAGYFYEGTLRNFEKDTSGNLADMKFYGLTSSDFYN